MITVGSKVKFNGNVAKVAFAFKEDGERMLHIIFDDKDLAPPELDVAETRCYSLEKKEEKTEDKKECLWHSWQLVGHSPVLNTPWYDCRDCGIKKEDYMNEL